MWGAFETCAMQLKNAISNALILLIRIYQSIVSPLLGPVCRFHPSCSRYAVACLELHGAAKGSWLTVRRLLRCHPFHPGGYDPPPLPPRHFAEARGKLEPSPSASDSAHRSGIPPAPC
jgi:hypothetical protein